MLTLFRTGLAGSLALALATTCVPAHALVTPEVAKAHANSIDTAALPDGQYEEFVFQSRIASLAEDAKLFFPTVQDFASGSERWVEIPASGQDPHALKGPAPELKVIKAQHQGHMARLEQTYALGDLTLTAPWARATPGGARVGGGFLKISNNGKEPDSLIGGSASFAGRMEVHEMAVTDGIMRMRELEKGLVIKPGQTIELKPGSFHMMFMDLKQPLKQGDSLKATLIFAKAGKIEVDFKVGGVADKADTTGGHKH